MSRKSLELTSIYGNRVSATNLPPRLGDKNRVMALENNDNTITPSVKSDNVNYRSVITNQWIK